MGYPEAEYAAQKVIKALDNGLSPSGVLSPLPSSVQLSIENGQITATISGNRSVSVSENVIAATDTVRLAFNTNNVPLTYEDYTAHIDFDLSDANESYTLKDSVEFDSNAVYYKVFAVSSTGIVNDTTIASYLTQGTLYGDGYVADSRYQLSWYNLHRNTSNNSSMHKSDITDDDLKTVYYGFNNNFISNAKISNKNGVFQQFDKTHPSSNWLQASFFKKCKPFVIDSKGNAVQQLDPDDFAKTVHGEPSIVSNDDLWDQYQGVYVWVPRLYFQCGMYRYSRSSTSDSINDGAYDLSSGLNMTMNHERPMPGYRNSTSTIVCSETNIPEENAKFAGSSKIPLLNHDLGYQEDQSVRVGNGYQAADNVINTITPGFTDKNGKTYSGIWIPCYYASENGKSWPKTPEMITSASSASTLIEKYKESTNVLLMGGTIWETLNTILTLIGKSFDVAGTYGIGFKSSEATGIAPVARSCTPSKSGFTFSDSGWNKILNSYVLGSNSYFLMDPYVHSRKWSDGSSGRAIMCYQSTKMDTEPFEGSVTDVPTNDKYLVLYRPYYNQHGSMLDNTEMTLYFGNILWADARRDSTATLVDNLPSMCLLGGSMYYNFVGSNAFDSMDTNYISYSHRSFRSPFEWRSKSDANELPVYDNFALRRAPKRHDDLGLSEFMSLYIPNKTNMDTYFSENLVAYATMVLPPSESYIPAIQEES